MLAADCRYHDEIYHDCSGSIRPHFASRLKEELYEECTIVNSKVSGLCTHPHPHANMDSKPFSQDVRDNTKGGGGTQGHRVLSCPLFSGLVLGKSEQGGLLHNMGQSVTVQMSQQQRSRLCMMEAPYSHPAAGYSQPADGYHKHGAGEELQTRSAEENRRMGTGMGVEVGLPAQAPYMSLNFHKILSKHGSIEAYPFTTLSQIKDSNSYHDKETASYSCNSQSPSSSSSPESHREVPHYIGTSVIITNQN